MRWKLKELLDRENVTAYQLVKQSGLSTNTIYPLTRGEAKRVSLETLQTIVEALDGLTSKRVSVCDLLERE
jgi:DNA-binding Xre family transcriptional regulator